MWIIDQYRFLLDIIYQFILTSTWVYPALGSHTKDWTFTVERIARTYTVQGRLTVLHVEHSTKTTQLRSTTSNYLNLNLLDALIMTAYAVL